MKQHQTNRFISRAAAMLLTVIMAFAGAQTAGAQEPEPEQKPCNVRFDISGKGTVKFRGVSVTNGKTIVCSIPSVSALTLTPETGYVVSSVTYDAPDWLRIDLYQKDDFQWILNILQYVGSDIGSDTPTIYVRIVFNKPLAGGADEALAVALTADDDLSLTGGWYKVESDLTLGHTVNLHGDTHIIIASGKTLTVNTSDQYGIYGSPLTDEYGISGYALTVSGEGTLSVSANLSAISVDNYTQTGCAVTLSGDIDGLIAKNNVSISGGSLTTRAYYGIDTNIGSITISGGTVSSSGEQCGLWAGDAVSITGGTVSASGDDYGIIGYSVSITGGQVTVSSGGIWSRVGDITLGWTSATDYITASGYFLQNDGQHVKIADGQTLYGGGFPSVSFTGTIGDPSALNGLMLRTTAAVTKSGTNEYTIWNADGWDAFCDALQDNDTYNRFSGKTVKLGADITVSRMAGSSQHDFCGTFDGQGYTLTFTSTENVNGVAPFSYVSETTPTGGTEVSHPAIRNLNVVADINTTAQYASALVGRMWCTLTIEGCTVGGTIQTSNKYAAGFIAEQNGNASITDCRSSVTIKSSVSGDGTHGGFVAAVNPSTVNITGCLFDGKLLGTSTHSCAGFVGFGGTVTITNSLFAPAEVTVQNDNSATFARGNTPSTTNCYYTAPPSGGWGATQGKQLRTIAAGEGVTLGHDGVATEYSVSGITAYKASGASGDSDPFIEGILYDEVLYAGSGDEVSLTLTNSSGEAPLGYYYPYSVSAGTLSGSTLTMPDQDVTVTVNTAALRSTGVAVPVSYVDAGGNTQTAQAIALDGTETGTVLGRNGEETWYFVGLPTVAFDLQLLIQYDINLILADGCTMNVTSTDGRSCIYVENNLHIYGQAEGTGILNAQKQVEKLSSDVIVIQDGTLHIHGGNVIATYNGTDKEKNAICFSRQENAGDVLVIDGGTLTANGNDGYGIFIEGGDARINGGQVTATGGNCGIAVSSRAYFLQDQIPSTLTLIGGTLTASSIKTYKEGTIAVAPGYTYTDGSNIYDSTTASATLAALNDVTLQPGLAAKLAPDQNYWTTYYNGTTGFTIDADEHACAYTATYGGDKLTLNKLGELGKEIPAGTAVIIVADNSVVSMTAATALPPYSGDNDLRGVDDDTPVADIRSDLGEGTFYVLGMTTVGDEQHFGFHRYTGLTMAAHKAFVLVSGSQALARSLTMVFDEASGIESAEADSSLFTLHSSLSTWFTLDGRRLQAKPTAPGIYINNGKKVVIK